MVASNDKGKFIGVAGMLYHFCKFIANGQDWFKIFQLGIAIGRGFCRRNCKVPFVSNGVAELAKSLAQIKFVVWVIFVQVGIANGVGCFIASLTTSTQVAGYTNNMNIHKFTLFPLFSIVQWNDLSAIIGLFCSPV